MGKVADLIPTGSRIALGSHGVIGQLAFDVIGRLQYQWEQGVWDEWYVAFADGRWAWLAEAQGRFYVTRRLSPRPVPRRVEPVITRQGRPRPKSRRPSPNPGAADAVVVAGAAGTWRRPSSSPPG